MECFICATNTHFRKGKAVALWICSLFFMIASVHSHAKINLTFLHTAVPKGAVCLDGSAPAYSYTEGFGDGSDSWMVYLQGGGWCHTIENCLTRTLIGSHGSSRQFPNQTNFTGVLDLDPSFNPDFYNWHKVYIYYCDGGSFMADIEHSVSNLTFRGARIFKVMMDELLSKGMRNAQNAILTGGSAGGLATTLHCDRFRALFPHNTRVKCISDSGFFILGDDLPGVEGRKAYFDQIVAIHELANSLPTSCTNKMDPGLCLFPENFVGHINTPVFLLESAFDAYQVKYSLVPYVGGKIAWRDCLLNFTSCNSTELKILRDFRAVFIETLLKLNHSSNRGMFVHSFYRHGHLEHKTGWTCSSINGNNILANKTIGEAVSNWYFDRSSFQMIDAQNDVPRDSPYDEDTDTLNQKCLATLSSMSSASHYIANILLWILMQNFTFLF